MNKYYNKIIDAKLIIIQSLIICQLKRIWHTFGDFCLSSEFDDFSYKMILSGVIKIRQSSIP